MRDLLHIIRELVWPSRSAPGEHRSNADAYVRPFVVLAIVLLAGPDIVALVEVSTLLDLLGATLFLTAMLVWHKMVVASVLDVLRRLFVPTECAMLLKTPGQPSAVALGVFLVVINGLILLIMAIAPYAVISTLMA